ncbi:amidase family protein [Pseudoalteromonas fenneropenaei]|uniref:Amidase family protein n=1 Tax=Pseudoalteromonas fenneropenaei TaxID=1737459 RepID=A0ABV7CQ13_9GAMM
MRARIVSFIISLITVVPWCGFADTFHELTIAELQTKRAKNELSYEQLTAFYLERIARIDPKLNSVISLNPNALQEAKQRDTAFNAGRASGMLFGVPVLIKDNIDVAGMVTTAGAKALQRNLVTQDAPLVAKLKAEGAIILGKTNLSEWANFKTLKSSSGYSEIGGQTKNPYNTAFTPCGSSSGSAVAVSANLTLVAIGTETDGSILCPSSFNGIVGFKPTLSKISQQGIVPIAHSQDTAGPMARTVDDAVLVYSAITGDIAPSLMPKLALAGKTLGLLTAMQDFYAPHQTALIKSLDAFAVRGVKILKHLPFNNMDKLFAAEFEILLYEFNQDVSQYLRNTNQDVVVKSLKDLVAFNQLRGDTRQDLLESALNTTDKDKYAEAKALINEYALEQLKALKLKYKIDVFVAPTTASAWPINLQEGDNYTGSSTWLAAMIGAPAITVPLQSIDGIPSGLTFFALPGEDDKVLAFAREFEQMTQARVAPKL